MSNIELGCGSMGSLGDLVRIRYTATLDVGHSGNGEGVVCVNVRLVGIVFYARCAVRRWLLSRTGVGGDSGRKWVVLRASSESVGEVVVPLSGWGRVGAVQV